MSLGDREIVDVELAPGALEFVQLVGDEPSDDGLPDRRHEHHDLRARQDPREMGVVRRLGPVGLAILEGVPEHRVQPSRQRDVAHAESTDHVRFSDHG